MARSPFAAALAAVVVFAGTAVFFTRLLEPEETVLLPSVPLSLEDEVTDIATPPAGRVVDTRYATSAECPQMDNPGGLDWTPKPDAGPYPTDGRVVLPTLGVEAPIVRVGVGTDGLMVVPRNARDVAWLAQGEFPGRTNNVVLAGHISYSRVAGSFFRVRELAVGDAITVSWEGVHYKYRVVWNCFFDRNTNLAGQIMGATDVPSVTLISCGGVFDSRARTHTQRVAVRAEMITPAQPEADASGVLGNLGR